MLGRSRLGTQRSLASADAGRDASYDLGSGRRVRGGVGPAPAEEVEVEVEVEATGAAAAGAGREDVEEAEGSTSASGRASSSSVLASGCSPDASAARTDGTDAAKSRWAVAAAELVLRSASSGESCELSRSGQCGLGLGVRGRRGRSEGDVRALRSRRGHQRGLARPRIHRGGSATSTGGYVSAEAASVRGGEGEELTSWAWRTSEARSPSEAS